MNGLIFGGDSFTWGQGLYYYSNLPNIKRPPRNQFKQDYVTKAQREYKDANRFARIVASYFKTFEITRQENGGSDYDVFKFLDNTFQDFEKEEISYFIFQTTQSFRSPFTFTYKGREYSLHINTYMGLEDKDSEAFYGWLKENEYDFATFRLLHKKQIVEKIKNKFVELENSKIKCRLLFWTNDYLDLINDDPFLSGKIIGINYQNECYLSIDDLMKAFPNFCIESDLEYFKENPPPDSHMTLEAHKIVADNIIERLKVEQQ